MFGESRQSRGKSPLESLSRSKKGEVREPLRELPFWNRAGSVRSTKGQPNEEVKWIPSHPSLNSKKSRNPKQKSSVQIRCGRDENIKNSVLPIPKDSSSVPITPPPSPQQTHCPDSLRRIAMQNAHQVNLRQSQASETHYPINGQHVGNHLVADPISNCGIYTKEERDRLQATLSKPLGRENVARRSNGQTNVAYLEGWRAIALANAIFGFDGWSSQIISTMKDYEERDEKSGKCSVGISCHVRVTLKGGAMREDIGFGRSDGQRSLALAFDTARKAASTDALKRALRQFGQALGNCFPDKDYLRAIATQPAYQPQPFKADDLYHLPGWTPGPPPRASPAPVPAGGQWQKQSISRQSTWAGSGAQAPQTTSVPIHRTNSSVLPETSASRAGPPPLLQSSPAISSLEATLEAEDDDGFSFGDESILAEAEAAMSMTNGFKNEFSVSPGLDARKRQRNF